MLPLCDFVVIVCSLSKETTKLFGEKEFSLMKESATIINIARGEIYPLITFHYCYYSVISSPHRLSWHCLLYFNTLIAWKVFLYYLVANVNLFFHIFYWYIFSHSPPPALEYVHVFPIGMDIFLYDIILCYFSPGYFVSHFCLAKPFTFKLANACGPYVKQ